MGEAAQTYLPRSIGTARLGVKAVDGRTRIGDLRQSGCLKVLMPDTFRPDVEAVLVNTAGGMTGGDRFNIAAHVGQGAQLTLTSQAAERVYKATDAVPACVDTSLQVGAGARLNWVPQETILFDGAALDRRLRIDMALGARVLVSESLVFGRALMGEQIARLDLSDRVEIRQDGTPIYCDRICLSGDVAAPLARRAVLNGAGAVTQLIYVAPDADAHLDAVREGLPQTGGASLLAEDILVLRIVAPDSFELRKVLMPVLDRLTGGTLPGTWRM